MKLQLLPSSFDEDGRSSVRQHLATFVINGRVSLDAGSLGFAATDEHRDFIRDVVLTHAHLDHIAGLPLFIDDLFATLREPIRIHAIKPVIDVLEANIFNWQIYPRFSELSNSFGPIVEYHELSIGRSTRIADLDFLPVAVEHRVPAVGFVISDESSAIALSGDTAEMNAFWDAVNEVGDLSALFLECALPDEMEELARASCHMTPLRLGNELRKFQHSDCPIYAINLKPIYRDRTIDQLMALNDPRIRVLDVGMTYEF